MGLVGGEVSAGVAVVSPVAADALRVIGTAMAARHLYRLYNFLGVASASINKMKSSVVWLVASSEDTLASD